ncbi:hypothetical protein HWV62_41046 [Athelia sp. TMB]|nr:hypothetical protein HWV62_41046 [Athelia sp. TMB]
MSTNAVSSISSSSPSNVDIQHAGQLAELLGPALAALGPLAAGIDQGITAGATNINAAARDAGEAVNQAAQGVGDAAQGVTQGAGETVAEVPGAADRTVHNLEHAGVAGDAITVLTGAPDQRRDLEQVVQPVLQAAQPLADGLDEGATALGVHVSNAADAAGEAVNQAAAGDIAQGTLQGAAGTIGALPGRADQILQAIDNNKGILGDLDRVLLGRSQ